MSLSAENISFAYPGRGLGRDAGHDNTDPVLDAVNLTLEPGERVALLGESGAGKTTFGKILAGYLTPSRGRVLVDGAPLPNRGPRPVQLIWQHPELALDPRRTMAQSLAEAGTQPGGLLN